MTIKKQAFAKEILANALLTFETVKTTNGQKHQAHYYKMTFTVYEPSNTVTITGSLHYYFNSGMHNYNEFGRVPLYDTIIDLCNTFNFEPADAEIHSIEFGVNIEVPFAPAHFISNVLAYSTAKLKAMVTDLSINDAMNVEFTQYRLKLYDKSKQFKIPDSNILRVEYKAIKMAKLKDIPNLKTLADLLKITILQALSNKLLKEFDNLIVAEPINTQDMTAKKIAKYTMMNNREYWQHITNASTRRNKKAEFKQLINEYGNGLHKQIYGLIRQKYDVLLELEQSESWHDFTYIQQPYIEIIAPTYTAISDNYALPQIQQMALFAHLDNRVDYASSASNTINNKKVFFLNKNKCSNCRKVLPDNTLSYCNENCKAKKDARNNRNKQEKMVNNYTCGLSLFG